ncbi:MAG: pyruvate, phosphate dikinase, partial [Deltaproteobacteria bacterium]|nr:pyruvate, phosphate dikinase [Deltaproteobacteria bacterium]
PMREMILAGDTAAREKALAKLLPLQREDFFGIFEAMGVKPVTIRTLDPPLHEFLPHAQNEIVKLAQSMGVSENTLVHKIDSIRETNPMLGHRGCRLGVTYPEITAMQARAIMEAACQVKKAKGVTPHPEIMIPLVGHVNELAHQVKVVREVAENVLAEQGVDIPYLVGTMIELPRAALTADQIAKHAEFFSFGTNDLTQTTFGLSRDDAQGFLNPYIEMGIIEDDPFQTLDIDGVGRLLAMGVKRGRATNRKLKIGICGEHGGDPKTIHFCHRVGLNYVSCSPFRVPIARLAAAQAAIEERDELRAARQQQKTVTKTVKKVKTVKKKTVKKAKTVKKKKIVKKKKPVKKKVAKKKPAKKKKVAKKKPAKKKKTPKKKPAKKTIKRKKTAKKSVKKKKPTKKSRKRR